MLDRYFEFDKHKTSFGTEVLAGVTTFLTMAYILLVEPQILTSDFAKRPTGLDFGAVFLATALASGVTTIAMGLLARLPIALAPGMGQNFLFISVLMAVTATSAGEPWRVTLGLVFWSGVLFFLVSLTPVRQWLIEALTPSFRHGIAVGIGLLVALVGLRNGHLLDPTEMKFGLVAKNIPTLDVGVFLVGLLVTIALAARKIPGAILLGIVAAGAMAVFGDSLFHQAAPAIKLPSTAIGLPKIDHPAMFQLDLVGSLNVKYWPFILLFLYVAMFDMTGTLIAVGERAGLMEEGELPRMREAVLVDSAGSVLGASLGTSTVTSYIESIAGVQQGGRTGLTAVVCGLLLLLSIVLYPVVEAFANYTPATAAALVFVGAMMLQSVKHIDWDDVTEAVPAFIAMIGIPLTFSIADGLALGLIIHPCGKLLAGRWSEIKLMGVVLAVALVLYFLYVRTVLQ